MRDVPKTAAEWFRRGLAELELASTADSTREHHEDLESAVQAFEQVLALEPNHEEAQLHRARTLAKLGEHEAALDGLVAAAAQSPQDLAITRAAATSLFRSGQFEQAVAAADRVLAENPDDGELLFYRASSLTRLHRHREAVAACDLLLSKPAVMQRVMLFSLTTRLNLLRTIALAEGNDPRAFDAFRETFESEARFIGGPMTPGEYYEVLSRFEDARRAYRARVEASATTGAWAGAVSVWLQVKRHDEALRASERLIALAPNDSRAWFNRAEALVAAGQRDAAIAAYERSLELEPGFLGAEARLKVVRSA